LFRQTGRWPALVGVDYAEFNVKSGRRHTIQWLMNAISAGRFDLITHDDLDTRAPNRVAQAYWRAGGLVMVSAHCANPANPRGGGLRDRGVDLASLLVRGTATHQRWMQQLDEIATALAELRDAGVVVLWRPFHEVNGGWFWWGQPAPGVFARVWRHLFDYFSRTRQLNNLLWVFGPNMGDDAARYYPGDACVDLVGFDVYSNRLDPRRVRGYRGLARLPKPFGLSEFGPHGSFNPPGDFSYPRLVRAINRHFPKACYFLAWNAHWSPAGNRGARELYRHPAVVTRAGLPARLFN
jgi:mannan endo-1,4-beta-mannosidase